MKPGACPVCGIEDIRPILRSPITTLKAEREIISGVMAYRCREGHVFLVPENNTKATTA